MSSTTARTPVPPLFTTAQGIRYSKTPKPDGSTSIMVHNADGEGVAAKRVKPKVGAGIRWYSLDGQTFADLEAVAQGMAWAVKS